MSSMDGASLEFVAFGILVALISNLSPSRRWRSTILLLANLVFIAAIARNPISLLPFAGFILMGFLFLRLVRTRGARLRGLLVATTILVYIWLKKYSFLPEASLLPNTYFVLGLSYVFFRVLHLIIDSPEDAAAERIGFGSYLLYVANFTTFVSGPIQRYDEFARDQFAVHPVSLDVRTVGLQAERIVRGMFKVNVAATLLHMYHLDALGELTGPWPASVKIWAALRLALLYPVFLYCNFSGYIDIVIALARLIRLRLPENFDRPFSATSVIDFWNRWHMTLSNWLKTYVYNPLLLFLMRLFPSPALDPFLGVICFFVTFFLIGVWHGRTSEFIVFGLLTGGGISINKLWQIALSRTLGRKKYKDLSAHQFYKSLSRGLNFVWFAFTLFWFWGNWQQINLISSSLSFTQWLIVATSGWMCVSVALAIWEWLYFSLLSIKSGSESVLLSRYARVAYASAFGLMVVVFTILLNQPAPEIVYRAF